MRTPYRVGRAVAIACLAASFTACTVDAGSATEDLANTSQALNFDFVTPGLFFNYTFPAGCFRATVTQRNSDGTVDVSGSWFGSKPPTSLQIAGRSVVVAADKSWKARLPAVAGLNAFRVSARDGAGNVFNNVCAVFAGDRVLNTSDTVPNGVVLNLAQGDIDDGAPNAPIGSLGDAARRVLKSEWLRTTLTSEINAVADQDLVGKWWYDFREFKFGSSKLSFAARAGALHVMLRLDDVRLNGKVKRGGLIEKTVTMDGKIDSISVEFDLLMGVDADGHARITGVIDNSDVRINNPHAEGDGLIGELFDDVITFFGSSKFKSAVRKGVTTTVRDTLASELEDLIDGIDKGGLTTTTLKVPNLTGGGSTPLTFAGTLAALQLQTSGLAARFNTTVSSSAPVALFGQTLAPTAVPSIPPRSTAGISVGAINQALLALYRAGYFKVADPNATFGLRLPAGSTMTMSLLQAPIVTGGASSNAVRIGFAASATVSLAGAAPVAGDFYITLRAPITVIGQDGVGFGDVSVESVDFDPGNVSGLAALVLPTVVSNAVRGAASAAVNRTFDNLKLFRIPSFRVPASLSDASLPAGARLGLTRPTIDVTVSHLSLSGDLGQL